MLRRKKRFASDFIVTIFGSARVKQNDKNYKEVRMIAEHLGTKGIDVVTGGGPGIMMAANEGHARGKKHATKKSRSIGLSIILPKEQKSNGFLDVEQKFKRFSRRLDNFMHLSNLFIVAPGGFGTILELFYTIQLIQVKQTCNVPVILLGDMWPDLIDWIEKWPLKHKYINKEDLGPLFLAKDAQEAITMINKAYEEFLKGDKNYCLNYKKYKLT